MFFFFGLIFVHFRAILVKKEGATMREKKEPAYEKCCFYCENGKASEDGETVFCQKKKKEVPADHACHAFFYDLLRRMPAFPKLPEVELPTLD